LNKVFFSCLHEGTRSPGLPGKARFLLLPEGDSLLACLRGPALHSCLRVTVFQIFQTFQKGPALYLAFAGLLKGCVFDAAALQEGSLAFVFAAAGLKKGSVTSSSKPNRSSNYNAQNPHLSSTPMHEDHQSYNFQCMLKILCYDYYVGILVTHLI
jgi:hypothetical protein